MQMLSDSCFSLYEYETRIITTLVRDDTSTFARFIFKIHISALFFQPTFIIATERKPLADRTSLPCETTAYGTGSLAALMCTSNIRRGMPREELETIFDTLVA